MHETKHTIDVVNGSGIEAFIHIYLDTVYLLGEDFKVYV